MLIGYLSEPDLVIFNMINSIHTSNLKLSNHISNNDQLNNDKSNNDSLNNEKSNDCKSEDCKSENCKSEDCKSEDCKSEDCKSEDYKSEDCKSDNSNIIVNKIYNTEKYNLPNNTLNNDLLKNIIHVLSDKYAYIGEKEQLLKLLLELFNYYNIKDVETNHLVHIMLNKISKYILKTFIAIKYCTRCPKTLFEPEFLKYIIENDMFFERFQYISPLKSVFSIILSDTKYVDYFNIVYMPKYKDRFLKYGTKLMKLLKEDVYAYIIPEIQLVNCCRSFIFLINKHCMKNCNIDSDLNICVLNMYTILYNSLYESLSLNYETLNIYSYLSDTSKVSSAKLAIKTIKSQNLEFEDCLQKMIEYDFYHKLLLENINKLIDEQEILIENSNLILTVLYSIDIEYGLKLGDNNLKKIISYIKDKFISTDTNIHYKTKIVIETPCAFLKQYKEYLLKLFIDIEKYNKNSGYYEKNKLRTKICDIIYKCTNKQDVPLLLNPKYSDELITLYVSHLTSLINELSLNIKKIYISSKNHNENISLVKNILNLNKSINILYLLNDYYKIGKNSKLYLIKISEFYFTLLNYSFNSKLYNELKFSKRINIYNSILTEYMSTVLTDIYDVAFSVLDDLSNNQAFISNANLNKILEKTLLTYKNLTYKNINYKTYTELYKVSDILEKLSKINKKESGVSSEIPSRYLDPILFTTINNPVEIPETEQIIDNYTIMNHLTFSETNPFSNNKLTKNELNKYNTNELVKNRINMFSEDFLSWKI